VFDIICIVFIVGFFAACIAYVHACDWILGDDDEAATDATPSEPPAAEDEAVAA
jgi:hypothetical protein